MPFGLFRRKHNPIPAGATNSEQIKQNKHEAALDAADLELAHHPRRAYAWLARANALAALERNAEALAAFDAALELSPDNPDIVDGRGNVLVKLKRFDEARATFQRLVVITSLPTGRRGQGPAIGSLANTLAALGRYEEELVLREYTLVLWSKNSDLQAQKGVTLGQLGLHREGLRYLERATQMAPDNPLYWVLTGRTLEAMDRAAESREAFERALALYSVGEKNWQVIGNCLLHLERYAEALDAYDRALVLMPNAKSWRSKAVAWHEMERYEAALHASEHALELDSDSVLGWVNKGDYLRHLKRFDEASSAVEHARELDPDNAAAASMAGRIFSDQERYQEAQVAFDRALALDPNRRNTWIALGDMHTARGEYEPALAAFERALAIGPVMPHITEQRDAALRALGRAAEIGSATSSPASAQDEQLLGNWTEPARQVLLFAREEAVRLGAPQVGDEHLLLELLAVPDGMAANVLRELGVQLDAARDAVQKLPLRPAGSGPDGAAGAEIGMGQRARDAIEGAVAQARGNKHAYVATQHLLLALSDLRDARTRDVWLLLGIKPARVYRATLSAMDPP